MADGDFALIHHGVHDLSGAALYTAVANVNIPSKTIASGAGLFLVSAGNAQVAVLEVNVAN